MQAFSLDHFDDFLAIARQQPLPQTLLLVFTGRELPSDHTPSQAQQFAQGTGGHLTPLGGIAKTREEIPNFSALNEEATHVMQQWDTVFVAAIDSPPGSEAASAETDTLIEKMIDDIRTGVVGKYLAFNREGIPLQLAIDE